MISCCHHHLHSSLSLVLFRCSLSHHRERDWNIWSHSAYWIDIGELDSPYVCRQKCETSREKRLIVSPFQSYLLWLRAAEILFNVWFMAFVAAEDDCDAAFVAPVPPGAAIPCVRVELKMVCIGAGVYCPFADEFWPWRIESDRTLLLKAGVILSRSSSTLLSDTSRSMRAFSFSMSDVLLPEPKMLFSTVVDGYFPIPEFC